ncbi:hypothetical protein WJX73_004883 [Symbiochloris irregularis]|uniref:cystathionine gamma-lyase n=1 Tax=Symbiochloris irregularis TaxID=706552 RepID=A0AAW1PHP2_9CHLO
MPDPDEPRRPDAFATLRGPYPEAVGHSSVKNNNTWSCGLPSGLHPETLCIAFGRPEHEAGNPVNVPLSASSTYHHTSSRDYARDGSDTVAAFESVLGALDHGTAVAFSSGMAAIAAVAVIKTLAGHADLLWLESMSNPLMKVPDVPAVIAAGKAAGATVVVDATFVTPLVQRPLELGADIAMHSITKFIGGHSDLLMGALVAKDPVLAEKIRKRRYFTGSIPGVLEAFLALRGFRSLPVRMQRHQENAMEIAKRLQAHPAVEKVLYPGLPSHTGHKRAAKNQQGFGAMMSFLVRGGEAASAALCNSVHLITNATSLGGCETLMERRAQYPVDAARGTPPNLNTLLSRGLKMKAGDHS